MGVTITSLADALATVREIASSGDVRLHEIAHSIYGAIARVQTLERARDELAQRLGRVARIVLGEERIRHEI